MAQNFNKSTRKRLRDMKSGMLVETNVLLGTAYLAAAQVELFTVYNRIAVLGLWFEVTTLWAGATLLKFTWTSSEPVIVLADISADTGSMDGFVAGARAYVVGTAVGTATNTEESAGITPYDSVPLVLGNAPTLAGVTSVGTIGELTSTAGTGVSAGRFGLLYAPIDQDAHVEALL